MPKTDQDRRDADSLRLETAYLEATRALESMPSEVSEAIWARIERSARDGEDGLAAVAPVAGGGDSKRRWWMAGGVAVGLAAALILALRLSPGAGVGSQGGSQVSAAVYRAKVSVEESAVLERHPSPRGEGARTLPSSRSVGSTPSTPQVALPVPGSGREPLRARPRSGAATGSGGAEAGSGVQSLPRGGREEVVVREPSAPVASSLAAETHSLAAAQKALDGGDPELALSLLARHASAFPRGFLREEAAALRSVALCRSEDLSAGRAAARDFLRDYPHSALRARVRDACPSTQESTRTGKPADYIDMRTPSTRRL